VVIRVEFEAIGRIKIKIWMKVWLESWEMCVKGSECVFCVSIWKDEVRFCWEGAGKWWVYERKTSIDVFAFAGQGSELAQLCLQSPYHPSILICTRHSLFCESLTSTNIFLPNIFRQIYYPQLTHLIHLHNS